MEPRHEEKYHSLKIRILYDEDYENPQAWGDDNLFLVGYHRDFWVEAPRKVLPKEQWTLADHKSVCTECGQRNFTSVNETGKTCGRCGKDTRIDKAFYKETQGKPMFSKEELTAYMEKDKEGYDVNMFKKYHVFPLEAYIHSGVCLALSREGTFPDRRWDVSQLGAVFVAKAEARIRDKARKIALSLIESWNDCLSGNVYGYQIEDEEGNELDACWGFIGDYDAKGGVLDEARSRVDSMTNNGTTDHNGQILMEFSRA